MAVGIDLVYIPRFVGKEKLAARILSPNELEIYNMRPNKEEFLAGRFAAKEAFLKAIKEGIGRIAFHKIDIVYKRDGRPEIHHDGKVYSVSISHDGDYAVAIVEIKE
ncbi:MAG: Holo-(acyl-carrier-protein) synthase [Tenericutes bacterium ADurb.Bin087]|nr:MAG: Holo-(acyl-carrier-protein) synthase [Tenericutes bacterium ADurb.Bin087]